jgi:hypothetical protein
MLQYVFAYRPPLLSVRLCIPFGNAAEKLLSTRISCHSDNFKSDIVVVVAMRSAHIEMPAISLSDVSHIAYRLLLQCETALT